MKGMNYFRVYRQWGEAFANLDYEETGIVFHALLAYAFDGRMPTRTDMPEKLLAVFHSMRTSIDVIRTRMEQAERERTGR